MTSATEKLCKLLDERGVKYETNIDECCYDEQPSTTWDFNLCGLEMTVTAKEFADVEGKTYLEMDFHHVFTPEQAVAATLGNETCELEPTFIRPTNLDGSWQEWTCSKCGEFTYLDTMDEDERPNFCQHCGAKAVDDVRD